MIINNDCARDILKALSAKKLTENIVLTEFIEASKYTEEEVIAAASYLIKAEYVMINNVRYSDDLIDIDKYTKIKFVFRWRESIPVSLFDDDIWNEIKSKIDISKYNFKHIVEMLLRRNIMELNKVFDIDNNITIQY